MRKDYNSSSADTNENAVGALMKLGFGKDACEKALRICKSNADDAAIWLLQHGSKLREESHDSRGEGLHRRAMRAQLVVPRFRQKKSCYGRTC